MPRYADKQWRVMLKMLAWRDSPVELSRRNAQDKRPPIMYRSRLFEVEPDGSIIVERPGQVVLDKTFTNGDDIELLLMQNGDRLVGTCTIRETFIRQINPTVRVCCYRLSPGRRPQREQRRAFFRVNVAGVALEPVSLQVMDSDEPETFKAQLVNLSGGGLGVSVRGSQKLLGKIKRTRRFMCTARFDAEEQIQAAVRVTHIEVRAEDLLYMGLQFDVEDEAEAAAVQDQMMHLCAQFQRAQLQRRKA